MKRSYSFIYIVNVAMAVHWELKCGLCLTLYDNIQLLNMINLDISLAICNTDALIILLIFFLQVSKIIVGIN